MTKVLIAYYSLTGNTKRLAEQIQVITGGKLFPIEMINPYPKVYQEVLKASRPDWENKIKPALKNKVENMEDYDIVFIGSPNWFSTMSPPAFSFLSEYDFSGKMVIPFMTHGGGGSSHGFLETAEAIPNCTVLEGLAISHRELDHTLEDKVTEWLNKVGIIH